MTPIRRRTFFGTLSNHDLKVLINESRMSDAEVNWKISQNLRISPELISQNAKDRELRLAANAVLESRLEAEEEGRKKMMRDFIRRR